MTECKIFHKGRKNLDKRGEEWYNNSVLDGVPSEKTKRKETNMHNRMMKAVCLILAVLMLSVCFVACDKDPFDDAASAGANGKVDMTAVKAAINSMKTEEFEETSKKTNYVRLTVKDHGDIVIRLCPDIAPISVKNFQKLVGNHFYDGLTFHRVMKNFMIQGGDPKGDGTGGSDTIKGEFAANGVTNNLSHVAGVISMARLSYPLDSASCQFFICNADPTYLDGQYAAFGFVVAGMETVYSISDVAVGGSAGTTPLETVVIEKACFVEIEAK